MTPKRRKDKAERWKLHHRAQRIKYPHLILEDQLMTSALMSVIARQVQGPFVYLGLDRYINTGQDK